MRLFRLAQPSSVRPLTVVLSVYIALSRGVRPDLGNKLSCFISLAPAVYAGPCLRHFPFSLMRRFAKSRKVWSLVFGGASPQSIRMFKDKLAD